MEPNNQIANELKDLGSSLQPMPAPYEVPEGYFAQLPEWILRRVTAEGSGHAAAETATLSPMLANLLRNTPYQVPAGYFEGLDLSYVWASEETAAELQELSPLLAGLKKEAPYSIPEGFFEKPVRAAGDAASGSPAPVIRMRTRRWFSYAAAAAITAIVVISAVMWYNPDARAIDPSKDSYAWVEKNMKKVGPESIENFVELADGDMAFMANATVSAEVKALIQDISDKELQDFLNDTGLPDTDSDDEEFF